MSTHITGVRAISIPVEDHDAAFRDPDGNAFCLTEPA